MTNRLHSLILTPVAFGPPPWLGRTLGALGLLALAAALVLALSSCSSGPQLPITTTPQSISCNYNITIGALPGHDASVQSPSGADGTAGVIVTDNDCNIDRSAASADPQTTGNDNRGVRVDPRTSVSATGPQ